MRQYLNDFSFVQNPDAPVLAPNDCSPVVRAKEWNNGGAVYLFRCEIESSLSCLLKHGHGVFRECEEVCVVNFEMYDILCDRSGKSEELSALAVVSLDLQRVAGVQQPSLCRQSSIGFQCCTGLADSCMHSASVKVRRGRNVAGDQWVILRTTDPSATKTLSFWVFPSPATTQLIFLGPGTFLKVWLNCPFLK